MEIEPGYLHVAQASIMKNAKPMGKHLLVGLIIMIVISVLEAYYFLIIPAVLIFVVLLYDVIEAKSYKYVFYSDRVIVMRGVFTKHSDQVFLIKVLAVRYTQTFAGRLFNYGNVFVDQLGSNDFSCDCISSPKKLVDALSPLVTTPGTRLF